MRREGLAHSDSTKGPARSAGEERGEGDAWRGARTKEPAGGIRTHKASGRRPCRGQGGQSRASGRSLSGPVVTRSREPSAAGRAPACGSGSARMRPAPAPAPAPAQTRRAGGRGVSGGAGRGWHAHLAAVLPPPAGGLPGPQASARPGAVVPSAPTPGDPVPEGLWTASLGCRPWRARVSLRRGTGAPPPLA